jgi:hypothetical protein
MHINFTARIRKIFGKDTNAKDLPESNWVFGCSPGAAGDIAADLDREAYPNIWLDGDHPESDGSFGTWIDVAGDTYVYNPLVASQMNATGRKIKGTLDDYWVNYGNTTPDPYIGSDNNSDE